MPYIDQINLQPVVDTTSDSGIIKDYFKDEMWKQFRLHENDKLRTINFWFIHRTVYVRDFEPFLVLFLGPEP